MTFFCLAVVVVKAKGKKKEDQDDFSDACKCKHGKAVCAFEVGKPMSEAKTFPNVCSFLCANKEKGWYITIISLFPANVTNLETKIIVAGPNAQISILAEFIRERSP